MSVYRQIAHAVVKGRRTWIIAIDRLMDEGDPVPESRLMKVARRLQLSYGRRSADRLTLWLPSALEMEFFDPELFLFSYLSEARRLALTDRELRVRLFSVDAEMDPDGVYQWRGFVQLGNLSTGLDVDQNRPSVRISAYCGLAHVERLIEGHPPEASNWYAPSSMAAMFRTIHMRARTALVGLHPLPIHYASRWRPVNIPYGTPIFDILQFNQNTETTAPSVGWDNPGAILKDLAENRLRMVVWQGLDGAWHMEHWSSLGWEQLATDGYFCIYDPDAEVGDPDTGIGEPRPANRPANVIDIPLREIGRGVTMSVNPITTRVTVESDVAASLLMDEYRWTRGTDGMMIAWDENPGLPSATPVPEGNGFMGRRCLELGYIAEHGVSHTIQQDTLFVNAGTHLTGGASVRMDGSVGVANCYFQVILFPMGGGDPWYLTNTGGWTRSPSAWVQPVAVISPLLWPVYPRFATIQPTPVPGLLRFVLSGPGATRPDTTMEVYRSFFYLMEDGIEEITIPVLADIDRLKPDSDNMRITFDLALYGGSVLGRSMEIQTKISQANNPFDERRLVEIADYTNPSQADALGWFNGIQVFQGIETEGGQDFPTWQPARRFIHENGSITTDLSELVAADVVDMEGSGAAAILARVKDRILGPETVLQLATPTGVGEDGAFVYDNVRYITGGTRIDLLTEETDGVFFEQNPKWSNEEPPPPQPPPALCEPQWIGASTVQYLADADEITRTIPAATEELDLVVFALVQEAGADAITGPTGFTRVAQAKADGNSWVEFWAKDAETGDEGEPITFTATSSGRMIGYIFVLRSQYGVDVGNIETNDYASTDVNPGIENIPGVATGALGALVVGVSACAHPVTEEENVTMTFPFYWNRRVPASMEVGSEFSTLRFALGTLSARGAVPVAPVRHGTDDHDAAMMAVCFECRPYDGGSFAETTFTIIADEPTDSAEPEIDWLLLSFYGSTVNVGTNSHAVVLSEASYIEAIGLLNNSLAGVYFTFTTDGESITATANFPGPDYNGHSASVDYSFTDRWYAVGGPTSGGDD